MNAGNIYKAILLLITAYCCVAAHAQNPALKFSAIQSAIDSARIKSPQEKVYIQFDKTDYITGDTIWLKAYLFNASYFTPSSQSGILYIDIANSDSVIVKQFRMVVAAGAAWGNIALSKQEFKEGAYTLRAYTNWMRNFDNNSFFYHRFTIAGIAGNSWLVNTRVQSFNIAGADSIRAGLQFTDIEKQPLAGKPLELQVISGKKTLYQSAITTTSTGGSDINFTVPGKSLPVSIAAEEKPSNKKIIIPLLLNRPENIDLQFMPEGGYLVAGLPSHIGFKAIGEDGRGANVKGIVVNSAGQQVASFRSLYKGMGSFNLLPMAGETYSAKMDLPAGGVKTFTLPVVNPNGTALLIKNEYGDDSLEITIAASTGNSPAANRLFIMAQSRDIVCYGASVDISNASVKKRIAKSLFAAGIARITLFTGDGQPVNERLTFIDARDVMHIEVDTDDSIYYPRDSIAVNVSAKDENNITLAGNFSFAVTDDQQVGADMLNRQNILSYMLLSSNLKGYVEGPGYYFQQGNATAWQALDNLLITQGWAGYNWQQVFNPQPLAYAPEYGLEVKGRAVNVFNKGIARSSVTLLSIRPTMFMDTITDAKGRFVFNHFPALDTPLFSIQARNKAGRSFNVGIEVDEAAPPAFTAPAIPPSLPWYVNIDTAIAAQVKEKNIPLKSISQGMTLQDVIVHAIKKVQGSKNLNGPGNADQVFNEADMEKQNKKTLLDMLQENVKGFRAVPFGNGRWFYIEDKWVSFIFDGANMEDVYEMSSYVEMRSLLERITAEDIKGIEVIVSPKNRVRYITQFIPVEKQKGFDYAFIEITTRAGGGPVIKSTPGTYVYKSIPFYWPKTFYSPRYAVKDTSDHTIDLRSTIYWAPNVITNTAGKTTVSFYAADRPTTYTILVEGTDFNGNVAVKAKKITVREKKE